MSISSPRLNRPGNRHPGRWARAGLLALVAVSPVLAIEGTPASTLPSPTAAYAPDRVIVAYKDGASEATARAIEEGVGAVLEDRIGPEARRLTVPRGTVEATVSRLDADPRVRYAEPDYYVYPTSHGSSPNDTLFHDQWALDNTGQEYRPNRFGTAGVDIDALRAWQITTGSNDVVVGIMDTGINLDHPDLVGNLWSNPGGLAMGGVTCEAGTHGYDFIDDDCVPNDTDSHGTRAAGIVGAQGNNGAGVTGIAWDVSLLGLRISLSNSAFNETGTLSNAAEAVWWAVEAVDRGVNIRVLNMSFASQGFSAAFRDALVAGGDRGILAVAGAGNDGRDMDAGGLIRPCAYDLDNVICVAATTSRDEMRPDTNWGTVSVDLAAPGDDNLSTGLSGEYMYFGATSGATPHVVGAAALVFSEFPSLTPQQVRAKILNNVDPLPSLQGKVVTGGRLNLYGALTGPIGETPTTTTPPTTVPPEGGSGGSGGSGGGGSGGSGGSQAGGHPPSSGGGTGGDDPGGSGAASSGATVNGGQSPKVGAGISGGGPGGTNPSRGSPGALPGGLWGSDVAVAGESVSKGAPPSGGARVTYDDDPASRGSGWGLAVGTALAGLGLASVGLWRSRAGRFRGHMAESVQLARPV